MRHGKGGQQWLIADIFSSCLNYFPHNLCLHSTIGVQECNCHAYSTLNIGLTHLRFKDSIFSPPPN